MRTALFWTRRHRFVRTGGRTTRDPGQHEGRPLRLGCNGRLITSTKAEAACAVS